MHHYIYMILPNRLFHQEWTIPTLPKKGKQILRLWIHNFSNINHQFCIVLLVGGFNHLENISQWEGLPHTLWNIKNVGNHQPVISVDILKCWLVTDLCIGCANSLSNDQN